jgi:hypothetical protein
MIKPELRKERIRTRIIKIKNKIAKKKEESRIL